MTARGKIKNIFEKLIIVKLEIGIYFRAVKVKNIAEIPNMVLKKWNLKYFFFTSKNLSLYKVNKMVSAKIDLKNIISKTWCWSIIIFINADITEKHSAAIIINVMPLKFFFACELLNFNLINRL